MFQNTYADFSLYFTLLCQLIYNFILLELKFLHVNITVKTDTINSLASYYIYLIFKEKFLNDDQITRIIILTLIMKVPLIFNLQLKKLQNNREEQLDLMDQTKRQSLTGYCLSRKLVFCLSLVILWTLLGTTLLAYTTLAVSHSNHDTLRQVVFVSNSHIILSSSIYVCFIHNILYAFNIKNFTFNLILIIGI